MLEANRYHICLFTAFKKSSAKVISGLKMRLEEEINTLKTGLNEAREVNAQFCSVAEPILDILNPASKGTNISSFQQVVELVQSAPSRFKASVIEYATVACSQALSILISLYPRINIDAVKEGYAEGTSEEGALRLINEVNAASEIIATDSIEFPEDI